jgi:hypothetical protein
MSVVLLTEPFSGGGGGSGTVTSVDVSGGTTGLTTSGGPVTTAGVITLGGTLSVGSGGTGAATLTGILKGTGTTPITIATAGTDYQSPITLTTTGTSGAATFVGNTLNIPQYSGGGGSGTVTSVALTAPSIFTVSGSPITTSGTLAISYSGTALPVANGGSGATTLTGILKGNGTSAFSAATAGTDYAPATSGTSILYGNGSGGFSNVTVGSGLSFITGTLSATGGGGTPGGSNTQIQFNNSGSFGGSANFTWDGTNVQLGTQGALRFADADSSNYVAFKSPATVGTDVTWTLPSADGTSSQVLSTNGSGTLSWVTQSGGGGGSPNLDGGTPSSNYGGITAIDGGTP